MGNNGLESSDSEAGAVSLGGCRRGNSARGRGDTAHASKKESSDSEGGTVFGCRRRIAQAQKRDSDSPDSGEKKKSVLRIRDPGPLDPGSGIRNRSFPGPGFQTHIFDSLMTNFWVKKLL